MINAKDIEKAFEKIQYKFITKLSKLGLAVNVLNPINLKNKH